MRTSCSQFPHWFQRPPSMLFAPSYYASSHFRALSPGWDVSSTRLPRYPACLPSCIGISDSRRRESRCRHRSSLQSSHDETSFVETILNRRFLIYILAALFALIILGLFCTIIGSIYLSRSMQPQTSGSFESINQLFCIAAIICGSIMLLSCAVLLRVLICKKIRTSNENISIALAIDRSSPLIRAASRHSRAIGTDDQEPFADSVPSLGLLYSLEPPAYPDIMSNPYNQSPPKYSAEPPPRYSLLELRDTTVASAFQQDNHTDGRASSCPISDLPQHQESEPTSIYCTGGIPAVCGPPSFSIQVDSLLMDEAHCYKL